MRPLDCNETEKGNQSADGKCTNQNLSICCKQQTAVAKGYWEMKMVGDKACIPDSTGRED